LNKIVIDTSISLAICLDDEKESLATKLLGEIDEYKILVPPHWIVEVSNGLLMSFRRERIEYDEIAVVLAMLSDLEAKTISFSADVLGDEIMAIAKNHKLTIYDAYYLHLAMAEGAGLATLDNALARAAKKEQVKIFE
jgi:predicted nucleic acid-binding protein